MTINHLMTETPPPLFLQTGVFNSSGGAHLRGMQQSGVHHINASPGVRAQVPQQFLPPQVGQGSVLVSSVTQSCLTVIRIKE